MLLALVPVLAACTGPNLIGWGQGWSALAIDDGVVYVSTRHGDVLAIDPREVDQVAWRFAPEKDDRLGGSFGKLAVGEDFVYVGDKGERSGEAGKLYALRKKRDSSSNLRPDEWAKDFVGAIVGGPALANEEGLVMVGSDDGTLYAFNTTGAAIGSTWTYPTSDRIWSTPTVANGTVYFGSMDRNVYALSLAEVASQARRLRWKFPTDGAVVAQPLIMDDIVVVGSFDRYLYAIDAATGAQRWKFKGADWFWAGAVTDGDSIYAPTMDGTVHALDREGRPLWLSPFKADSPIVSTPVVVKLPDQGDLLVVATDAGRLHLISARDGAEVAVFMDLGSRIKAPLAVEGQEVFVGLEDGTVRGINVNRWGVEIWSVQTKR